MPAEQPDPILEPNDEDCAVLPRSMRQDQMVTIARKLSRFKAGALSDSEQAAVDEWLLNWVQQVCAYQDSPFYAYFSQCRVELLAVTFTELEYLVHQELVSRQLGVATYAGEIHNVLDLERLVQANYGSILRVYLARSGFSTNDQQLSFQCTQLLTLLNSYRMAYLGFRSSRPQIRQSTPTPG